MVTSCFISVPLFLSVFKVVVAQRSMRRAKTKAPPKMLRSGLQIFWAWIQERIEASAMKRRDVRRVERRG
jgi:hypothetical protein